MSRDMRRAIVPAILGAFCGYISVAVAATILFGAAGILCWALVIPAALRMPTVPREATKSVGAFVVGFAVVFTAILLPQHLSCQPPTCIGEGWPFDLLGAGSTLLVAGIPVLVVWLIRRRESGVPHD